MISSDNYFTISHWIVHYLMRERIKFNNSITWSIIIEKTKILKKRYHLDHFWTQEYEEEYCVKF